MSGAVVQGFDAADKARMAQMVGAALAALQEPSLSDADRAQLQELIGTVSAVTMHESLFAAIEHDRTRIALLESQLAALQRATATTN